MTVSRKEREAALIGLIAEGDGDSVNLDGLDERSVMIIKDLSDNGFISGTTFLNGDAHYRITSAGEDHAKKIMNELSAEEIMLDENSVATSKSSDGTAQSNESWLRYLAEKFVWPVVVGVVLLAIAAFTFL